MRSLALILLLFWGSLANAGQPSLLMGTQVECVQGFPEWLVADVLEAACVESQHFSDIGMESLLLYYHDGTAAIDYLGRDAVNPAMGRYRVVAGGGMVTVEIIDLL